MSALLVNAAHTGARWFENAHGQSLHFPSCDFLCDIWSMNDFADREPLNPHEYGELEPAQCLFDLRNWNFDACINCGGNISESIMNSRAPMEGIELLRSHPCFGYWLRRKSYSENAQRDKWRVHYTRLECVGVVRVRAVLCEKSEICFHRFASNAPTLQCGDTSSRTFAISPQSARIQAAELHTCRHRACAARSRHSVGSCACASARTSCH